MVEILEADNSEVLKSDGMLLVRRDTQSAVSPLECQVPSPTFGNIHVEGSSEVQFGNNVIYHGPVVINKVLTIGDLDQPGLKSGGRQLDQPFVNNNVYHKEITECDNLNFVDDSECGNGSEIKTAKLDDGLFIISNKGIDIDKQIFKNANSDFRRSKWMYQSLFGVAVLVSILLMTYFTMKSVRGNNNNNWLGEDSDETESNSPIGDTNGTVTGTKKLRIVSRPEWIAQPPQGAISNLKLPVPYVIIHHTATGNCTTRAQCVYQCRQIQTYHIESNGWFDIGYNFMVGGDGNAYECRGFYKEGAHTYGYNFESIGISFIGTFNQYLPNPDQIRAAQQLIKKAASLNILTKNYKVFAASQLQKTLSPGPKLAENITTWDHWAEAPNS